MLIIDDGKYSEKNLTLTGTTQKFFDDILHERKVKSVRHVFVLTLDGTGKIYMQCKGEKFCTFRIKLPEGSAW